MTPSPALPLEITLEIYRLLFPPSYFDQGIVVQKPDWKDIEGLTLTCKASRDIILGLWFHVLRVDNVKVWKLVLNKWKRLYQWTRALHYSSSVYKTPKSLLEPFQRLNTIRIDLPPTHVTADGDFDFAAPEISQILHEGIPGHIIQHLDIRGITWLDPFVMRHLAECLPNLRTLQFKQPLVWCGLCNTNGIPSFKVIPGKLVYEDGHGLPNAYSHYLAPLRNLHTIRLTVACGNGGIFYDSLFSNWTGSSNPPTSSVSSSIASKQPHQNSGESISIGWSGECDACMIQLLNDDVFRESWKTKKDTFRHRAMMESTEHQYRPPLLRRVEWELLEISSDNWPDLLPNGDNTMYNL